MIFRTRSIKVPLPPPDGELTTISIPCGAVMAAVFASCVCVSSFNILHLFAKFLNLSLNGQGGIFDGDFGGFRQNRVSLPIEFLEQEIQSLADRKSTRLNSSHVAISYAVFCLKKKNTIK